MTTIITNRLLSLTSYNFKLGRLKTKNAANS